MDGTRSAAVPTAKLDRGRSTERMVMRRITAFVQGILQVLPCGVVRMTDVDRRRHVLAIVEARGVVRTVRFEVLLLEGVVRVIGGPTEPGGGGRGGVGVERGGGGVVSEGGE
jgi:hypothetical protein